MEVNFSQNPPPPTPLEVLIPSVGGVWIFSGIVRSLYTPLYYGHFTWKLRETRIRIISTSIVGMHLNSGVTEMQAQN